LKISGECSKLIKDGETGVVNIYGTYVPKVALYLNSALENMLISLIILPFNVKKKE